MLESVTESILTIIRSPGEIYLTLLFGGVILLICRVRSRIKDPAGIVLWLLVFGCMWRILYPHGISSSRYCESLLYPVSWCCGMFAAFWLSHDLHLFGWRCSGRWIFAALMFPILFYAVAKVVRIQPKPLKQCASIIRRDCGSDSGLILCSKEGLRIGYYSGLETKALAHVENLHFPQLNELVKRELRRYHYSADRVYALIVLSHRESDMIAKWRQDPEIRVVAESDYRKRSSSRIVVLTAPPRPELALRSVAVPNGDFSTVAAGAVAKNVRASMVRRGALFFRDERILLPAGWNIYSRDPRARVFLEDGADGRHIRLAASGVVTLLYGGVFLRAPELWGIRFAACGKAGTVVEVRVWKVDRKAPLSRHVTIAEIRPGPGRMVYSVPLKDCDVSEGGNFSFELVVRGGEAAIDDVELLYSNVHN